MAAAAGAALAATVLALLPVVSAAEGLQATLYADKTKQLLAYLDAGGRSRPVSSVDDWHKRREHVLANMQRVMGPLPAPDRKVPLDVQVAWSESLPKVSRKKITYVSERNHRVPAYLLIPAGLKGKAPAMLCLHGTDGSRGRTAGLGPDYARYAIELAERGYVTLAPDYITLGENTAVDPYKDLGYVSASMKGIWDHIRAVDVLQSLPEVEGERMGVVGLSLGGHNALFVAVFDPRLKVIVTSSGFDSFYDYKGGGPGALRGWAGQRYMPLIETACGLAPDKVPFDFPEVLAALAPRPLFIHAPLQDDNFNVASVKRCAAAAKPVYRLFGAEERIVSLCPEGGHGFPPEAREAAYAFVDEALRNKNRQSPSASQK